MKRRTFLVQHVAFALTLPRWAEAQTAAKPARIGYLAGGSVESPEGRALLDVFRRALIDHGYVEGKNLLIEYRSADGKIELLPDLAAELMRFNPNVIVAASTAAARAAQQATHAMPIVAFAMTDP
jgi:putative ABC transport system substrate-binding protein